MSQEQLPEAEQPREETGLSRRSVLERFAALSFGFAAALALGARGAEARSKIAGEVGADTGSEQPSAQETEARLADAQDDDVEPHDPRTDFAQRFRRRRRFRFFRRRRRRVWFRFFRRRRRLRRRFFRRRARSFRRRRF